MHWLDRINPFLKLAIAALVTAASWLAPNAIVAMALAAAVLLFMLYCRLPAASGYFKIIGLVAVLVTASWALTFISRGMAYDAAIAEAIRLACRLIVTTGSFFIAIETTSAGVLLAACGKARLPGTFTLVLFLVVGMIPLMREEFQAIGDVQRARGLELDRGPILRRVLHTLARGVPLMVQTYRMAEAISLTLSLYGFDPGVKRTSWRDVGLIAVQNNFSLRS
ncbi:MAG: hypothetical protein BGP04_20395 [Rhizobiales bacterium 62-17]|nr:energy-coupling factor transporter transmembrane protein EcfT [Hyphomicrobiales bacterium]OJX99993.1 MAG: hypothetical protein BGP04_20395 [Rhizobiales bacterium 62-17]